MRPSAFLATIAVALGMMSLITWSQSSPATPGVPGSLPDPAQPGAETSPDLPKARAGFKTRVTPNPKYQADGPVDPPPAKLFSVVRYPSPAGKLAAYLSPDPGDGKKHPAVVYAHGGFGGINGMAFGREPFVPFREAGFVLFCPSWRGENDNPGKYEMFFGEVDDAVASLEYLAKVPYVDPARIYMVGHSTGGTITLLTAESSPRLRAAFSFGGAPDLARVDYGTTPVASRAIAVRTASPMRVISPMPGGCKPLRTPPGPRSRCSRSRAEPTSTSSDQSAPCSSRSSRPTPAKPAT
jgi:pimeloyl-ACP methyl ester carboxylesterase